jgi:hypothetical protein
LPLYGQLAIYSSLKFIFKLVEELIVFSHGDVTIQGAIPDANFGDVTVLNAMIDIEMVKSNGSQAPRFLIKGTASWNSLQADVGVYLYKKLSGGDLGWTIYGELNTASKDTRMSDLVPSLKGSFMDDISFKTIGLLAASDDDPTMAGVLPYPVKKEFS